MTVIRTYRPTTDGRCMCPDDCGCRNGRPVCGCSRHVVSHSERVFRDPVLAGAWADFMALAGYVVEIEGGRA